MVLDRDLGVDIDIGRSAAKKIVIGSTPNAARMLFLNISFCWIVAYTGKEDTLQSSSHKEGRQFVTGQFVTQALFIQN